MRLYNSKDLGSRHLNEIGAWVQRCKAAEEADDTEWLIIVNREREDMCDRQNTECEQAANGILFH